MNWLFLYDKDTLQIEQVISNSFTMPTVTESYDEATLVKVEVVDPLYQISRDHKVMLEAGEVVNSEPSLNPIQPSPLEPRGDLVAEIDEIKVKLFGTKEEPPRSTHISTIDTIDTAKVRPVRIKWVWEGMDYFYDCFVTESVKDQYVAGDVKVGDYVIVHFDDIGEQIVTAKVFKSW